MGEPIWTGMLSARTRSRQAGLKAWGAAACSLVVVLVAVVSLTLSQPAQAHVDFSPAAAGAVLECTTDTTPDITPGAELDTTPPDVAPPDGGLAPGTGLAPDSGLPPLMVGDKALFWTLDWATNIYSRITATARYVGQHVVVYVDDEQSMSQFIVDWLGSDFDSVIYPTLTAAYGSEPNPGLDNDPRVVILIYDFNDPLNDVDGAFYTWDIDPDGHRYSNMREMFYLNAAALESDPGSAPELAAHEFSHLILHYQDRMLDPSPQASQESIWVAEGLSTYGEYLCGYGQRVGYQLLAFTRDPNFGLTHWRGLRANYGASYGFMSYLADWQGPAFLRALVQQPLDGPAGIEAALSAIGSSSTFTSVFDDWVVANFLDSRGPETAPYYFSKLSITVQPQTIFGVPPLLGAAEVADYGAAYIDFPAALPSAVFQVALDGEDAAPLQAALISWDSKGERPPVVQRFSLENPAVGGTVEAPLGFDRHTLAVWARGIPGSAASYRFVYSGTTNPPGGIQFLDMGGDDPYYKYVRVLLDRGVINGREIPPESGLWYFMGGEKVLRAQFAKMIMEAIERHTEEIDNDGNPTFKDVPSVYDAKGYPFDYVEEAVGLGIVQGYAGGEYFGPWDAIKRGQLVLMISRGAKAAGSPLPAYHGPPVFADVPASHPLFAEIMAAYSANILQGSKAPDGRWYFYPNGTATRNHVAKMTANLLALLASG